MMLTLSEQRPLGCHGEVGRGAPQSHPRIQLTAVAAAATLHLGQTEIAYIARLRMASYGTT